MRRVTDYLRGSRKRTIVALASVPMIITLLVMIAFQAVPSTHADDGPVQRAAKGTLQPPIINTGTVTRTGPNLSDGVIEGSLSEMRQDEADLATGQDGNLAATGPTAGSPGSLGCSGRDKGKGNARVNQDCTFRRQAEEQIIFNPADPNNLIAGQNDSRVGFNQCGIDWSTDNGRHWGDMLPPFRQRFNNPASELPTKSDPNRHTILGGPGTNHTYDFGSDPTVAFDTQGNAFFSCLALDVATNAALLYVTASPAGAGGSFYLNLAQSGRKFIVAEDNNPTITHDKEFITADTNPSSPNRDNVYVTWTVFRFGCPGYCQSPIYGSMSTDHARTWSTPELISGSSATLCFFGNFFDASLDAHACNFDQGSEPRALPNGDLVVTYNNGNTAASNPNSQQLAVHCHPTGSSPAGTAHLNCNPPTKVGDDVTVGEPFCSFGRECIPGAFIRTNDFPRLAVNPANGNLYAVWQDYRNQEFDIQLATSTDGGLTWGPSVTVNPDSGLDHYFAAIDVAKVNGDRVGVSYYRTERVPNENTTPVFSPPQPGVQASNSDYVLAGGTALQAPYDFRVVSPIFPAPDGNQAGFNGDYSGLTINKGTDAHPIWSDTRNTNPFPENGVIHDEDVFTDNVGLPNGNAQPSVGQIGKS